MKPSGLSRYQLDKKAFQKLLALEPRYRTDQIWEGLYKRLETFEEMTNIPKALRQHLEVDSPYALTEIDRSHADNGNTVKWLWKLADDAAIETVLMHYTDRSTVCVSSQAGCAMACEFCATGQAGFKRHLDTGEIVEQVVRAIREALPRRVSNIVFMGMGEPLANYEATWAAVDRFHSDLGLSARRITISTIGIVPGIRRLSNEALPVNLAVSLHAANDSLRDKLVPINKRYPISELIDACSDYLKIKNRRLSFEWALINGVNDQPNDARELASISNKLRAHVNLIPLNPTQGFPASESPIKDVRAFHKELISQGVNATIRRNRGTAINAACGQLQAHDRPTLTNDRNHAPVNLHLPTR